MRLGSLAVFLSLSPVPAFAQMDATPPEIELPFRGTPPQGIESLPGRERPPSIKEEKGDIEEKRAPQRREPSLPVEPKETEDDASLRPIEKEFLFLRERFADASAETLGIMHRQAEALLEGSRQDERADHILLLIAEILRRQNKPVESALACLRLLYEQPSSKLGFNAKRMIAEISDRSFKKRKDELGLIAEGPRLGLSREDRAAALLERLAAFSDPDFHGPTAELFHDFFGRYPGHSGWGELTYLLAGLHSRAGEPRAAIFLYEKILALSSSRSLKASAQNAIGDLYVGTLKDDDKAVGAYQSLTDSFAESDEAAAAYGKWARILDERLGQPMLAVDVLEKAVQIYPGSEIAHSALSEISRIQSKRLKNPARAVETLERLAEMFPGEKAAAALLRAVEIHLASGDAPAAARTYVRIQRRDPAHPRAAEMLWEAARVYDKKAKDEAAARRTFEEIVEVYPSSPWAKKAQEWLESLK